MENFAQVPKSFTELKADKSGKSDDWTPRDALIWALRAIDSGEISPETIIICYHQPSTDELDESTHATVAGKANWLQRMGILEMCKLSIL